MVPEKIEWFFHTFERHHRLRRTHHPTHLIGESANDPDSNCTGYMYVCVWELVDITCVRAHFITFWKLNCHYYDVIMGTIASQITSLTIICSTVYSDADQRKHQSSASLAFVWGIHRDRWIPRTNGQWRGKCFHLMTSSCRTKLLTESL